MGQGVLISREARPMFAVALTTSLATTPEIPFQEYAGGTVEMPATTLASLLTLYGAVQPLSEAQMTGVGQTFQPLKNSANAAVTMAVSQAGIYPLPSECFGCAALKFVADVAVSVNLNLKG